MADHKIVSREEWLEARQEHLKKEKEFTHLRDEVSRQRRELPWVEIDKDYVFETDEGKRSLADLFEGRSQLITYHFMFHPDWAQGLLAARRQLRELGDASQGSRCHARNGVQGIT